MANTETITGGTGNDTVTLSTAVSNASVDLGAGSDSLTFGNFANTATVANTETITGGTGADSVTLGGAAHHRPWPSTSAQAATSSPWPTSPTPAPSRTPPP